MEESTQKGLEEVEISSSGGTGRADHHGAWSMNDLLDIFLTRREEKQRVEKLRVEKLRVEIYFNFQS